MLYKKFQRQQLRFYRGFSRSSMKVGHEKNSFVQICPVNIRTLWAKLSQTMLKLSKRVFLNNFVLFGMASSGQFSPLTSRSVLNQFFPVCGKLYIFKTVYCLNFTYSVTLQICSWEFCARRHEELIPRRLLPQVKILCIALILFEVILYLSLVI